LYYINITYNEIYKSDPDKVFLSILDKYDVVDGKKIYNNWIVYYQYSKWSIDGSLEKVFAHSILTSEE